MTLPERARPATLRRRRQATIINLAIEDPEAQRLLGCFLTILAEQDPLSRAELPPDTRFGSHLLKIDEAPMFLTHSGESLEVV